jgi:nitrogen fixation NifU-like protein
MSSELRDLYQETILDHGRRPRNFRTLAESSHQAEGYNPLCGDRVQLFARLEGETLRELSFQGAGCAISQASASLLTECLQGRSRAEVDDLTRRFLAMLKGGEPSLEDLERLDKLAVFSGVCEYPMRVKCATLAWHTLQTALNGGARVSTE